MKPTALFWLVFIIIFPETWGASGKKSPRLKDPKQIYGALASRLDPIPL